MKPQVLVTGAGGFLGRHLTQALLEAGWFVHALDAAFDTGLAQRWGGAVACHVSDLHTLPDVKVDAVVHAAAITASPEDRGETPEANLRANLDPLLRVLEWAQAQGTRRVIGISSSGVFRATPPGPLDETAPLTPLGSYAVAKQLTESWFETLRTVYQRNVAVIRLSSIYGPGEIARATRPRLSLVGRYLQQALAGGIIQVYNPEERRDWTFAPDVGVAVVRLLQTEALHHALYNVASGQVLTSRQVAETIHAAVPGTHIVIHEEPESGLPPLTRHGHLSSERLRADTGFADWTPFERGIQLITETLRTQEQLS